MEAICDKLLSPCKVLCLESKGPHNLGEAQKLMGAVRQAYMLSAVKWAEISCSKSLNFKGSDLDLNPYAAGLVFATSSSCAKLFCLLQQPCCDHQGRAGRSDPPDGGCVRALGPGLCAAAP